MHGAAEVSLASKKAGKLYDFFLLLFLLKIVITDISHIMQSRN